eukprot:TRINITY_DN1549_c0_g1_i2.p1 TRINITY_DN1549_c0_g1~~TRINITY_DN1549_c0_g1_i2.p1  ORF type:complete len:538 (+),score=75.03 TRINITY_DN1549_c0_g1_i2:127-1740(+)
MLRLVLSVAVIKIASAIWGCQVLEFGTGGAVRGAFFINGTSGHARLDVDILHQEANSSDLATTGGHGWHLHAESSTDNSCVDAAGHWDPFSTSQHAWPDELAAWDTHHVGDLGNMTFSPAGSAHGGGMYPGLTNDTVQLDLVGRTFVIHASSDQGSAEQPSGAAGSRIGCCLLQTWTGDSYNTVAGNVTAQSTTTPEDAIAALKVAGNGCVGTTPCVQILNVSLGASGSSRQSTQVWSAEFLATLPGSLAAQLQTPAARAALADAGILSVSTTWNGQTTTVTTTNGTGACPISCTVSAEGGCPPDTTMLAVSQAAYCAVGSAPTATPVPSCVSNETVAYQCTSAPSGFTTRGAFEAWANATNTAYGIPSGCTGCSGEVATACAQSVSVRPYVCTQCFTSCTSRQPNGAILATCGQGTPELQGQCLETAVCDGAIPAGSQCRLNGMTAVCPECSESKKGLLGLLGLLGLIPLLGGCLLLIVACICLKRRKRTGEPTHVGTVTSGAGPVAGSAFATSACPAPEFAPVPQAYQTQGGVTC